jgi:hypothetical protein
MAKTKKASYKELTFQKMGRWQSLPRESHDKRPVDGMPDLRRPDGFISDRSRGEHPLHELQNSVNVLQTVKKPP